MTRKFTQAHDRLGRPLKDLRISLTDQCNFRCNYCMPKEIFGPQYQFLPKTEYLDFDQITTIVKACVPLGIEKVRLTGGEPLLRKNVADLIRKIRTQTNIADIALTTNGFFLKKQLSKLKKAGLNRINVSLDAVDKSIFKTMSGGFGDPKVVIDAIEASQESGLQTKFNAVIKKGVNEDQIIPLIELGMKVGVEVRFVEFMDVGITNQWKPSEVYTETDILSVVASKYAVAKKAESNFEGVSNQYSLSSNNYCFGIISSISKPFCSSCVRARLSSDGKLYTCLFSNNGHDIKPFIDDLHHSEKLQEIICNIWNIRHDRYSEIRDTVDTVPSKKEMSYLGG